MEDEHPELGGGEYDAPQEMGDEQPTPEEKKGEEKDKEKEKEEAEEKKLREEERAERKEALQERREERTERKEKKKQAAKAGRRQEFKKRISGEGVHVPGFMRKRGRRAGRKLVSMRRLRKRKKPRRKKRRVETYGRTRTREPKGMWGRWMKYGRGMYRRGRGRRR